MAADKDGSAKSIGLLVSYWRGTGRPHRRGIQTAYPFIIYAGPVFFLEGLLGMFFVRQ